jgi:2',3'-cyclic-nucleotide 2'-phosphodiesterase (5'-nucleotidase family)
VIIAITHQDLAADVELARAVPEIDLVIGGHDHVFMQERVDDTWITKADADARSVVVYDVTAGPRGVRTVPLRVVLDGTVARDVAIDARVQQWRARLEQTLGGNETIGSTENLLEGVEPAVRGRETALGNLLADAVREQMQTDLAFVNGGSIRINDNIPPGPITRYDMEGIFYYTNRLVAFRLTGEQLLEMLRTSVARADAGDGRFLQVSGLRFRYAAGAGGFTVAPEDVEVGGRPLDLSATYTVGAPDYLWEHGTEDGYMLFADATRPPKVAVEREADFRETVEKYIRDRKTVDVEVEGRIVRR